MSISTTCKAGNIKVRRTRERYYINSQVNSFPLSGHRPDYGRVSLHRWSTPLALITGALEVNSNRNNTLPVKISKAAYHQVLAKE